MTTLSHLFSFLFSPIRLPVDGKERKMNIKTVVKKNGQTVYRASVYLGVDQMTGKKPVPLLRLILKRPSKSRLGKLLIPLQTMDIVLKINQRSLLIES